ncbi:hypothetical protein VZT92_002990 [Zoarces viviparus]|uniref:U6 snRNA-associated Sm-like protein LSm6 n=1 Tax=Zoarces viviparus TaxID=48416 RepID=A0AAW1G026_ZOAVI
MDGPWTGALTKDWMSCYKGKGGHSLFSDPDNTRQLSPSPVRARLVRLTFGSASQMLPWVSVQCTSLIGQYAAHAKYYRLEKVYRITVKMSLRKQTPSDFLKQIIGRPVVVKLNSGVDYRGVLACLDGYMNIAIEQTEEYVNGQLKNKYGDAFLRGNNVLYISTQKRKA